MLINYAAVLVACLLASALAAGQLTTSTHSQENVTTGGAMKAEWISNSGAMWVWPKSVGDAPNQYVQMMQNFQIPEGSDESVQIAISADTDYAVWLNGKSVAFGQWKNFPDDKTYDVLDLKTFVRAGDNRLCVEIYYDGQNSSTYEKGAPGAVYAVQAGSKIVAVSGVETQLRLAPNYVSGPIARVTGQLSFTFEHRADKGDNWLTDGYPGDPAWRKAEPEDMQPLEARPVRPRPIEKLITGPRTRMRVLSQGAFKRHEPEAIPGVAMHSDALSFREAGAIFAYPRVHLSDSDTTGLLLKPDVWKGLTGPYLILDIEKEEAGLMELEVDVPKGTIIDVGYGEHLEDLRVRTSVGGRNFANRYVSGEGRQTFLHPFLRLAGRYIQVHITPPAGAEAQPIILQYAGVRPTWYPVAHTGIFKSSDSLHDKIWDVSRRTLELCMHEHYEDCPWREQALYAMDARNQALAGYYCFGNYDFAAASWKLLGQGMNEKDGFLELCSPGQVGVNIPSFSLAWILALDDYMLFSGDRDFVKSQLPIARRIIERCNRESTGPIVGTPQGKRMWNFYEWAPGLDGSGSRGFEVVTEERFEAPLNLFYLLALDAMAKMAKECGDDGAEFTKIAGEVRAAFADKFWDGDEKAFLTRVGDGNAPHFAELTQALAILAGVVPEAELGGLRDRLARDNNGMVPCTISHTLYKFEALLTDRDRFAARVFELIERDWGFMLGQGATSFWETIDGASAFGNAGSLCHGWSGIPAWFYGAYVLGVKPTAPGFKEYDVKPISGVFTTAEGTVPTPDGQIDIKWNTENGQVRMDVERYKGKHTP